MTLFARTFAVVLAGLGLVLAACSASADSPSAAFEDHVVSHTPTERAIAASSTFFNCRNGKEAEQYWCYACEVTLHDADKSGLVAYASDYEHMLEPWEAGEASRISVTGEVGTAKFESDAFDAASAHRIFDEANAWCKGRRKGSFHLLKDEVDTYFSGEGE
jgi:hypothetical protein